MNFHLKPTVLRMPYENDGPDNACPVNHLKTYVTYENDCKSYFAGGATYQLTPCMLAPPVHNMPPRNRSRLSDI